MVVSLVGARGVVLTWVRLVSLVRIRLRWITLVVIRGIPLVGLRSESLIGLRSESLVGLRSESLIGLRGIPLVIRWVGLIWLRRKSLVERWSLLGIRAIGINHLSIGTHVRLLWLLVLPIVLHYNL